MFGFQRRAELKTAFGEFVRNKRVPVQATEQSFLSKADARVFSIV